MSERGGTGLSSKGLYIEQLITQSFAAVTALLSISSTFQTLLGHVRRVTDLLSVVEEIKAERAQQQRASGDVADPNCIALRDVEVVAPDGTCVASELSFELAPGESLRVMGPTGCGKSSVARVVAGIWQPPKGSVLVPPGVVMVPQQPLVTTTAVSLLDFLTYPQFLEGTEAAAARASLEALLTELGVGYLADRDGWRLPKQWDATLSLGEQQVLGCARILFQLRCDGTERQRWVCLDDATSALAADLEQKILRSVAAKGVGVIQFSERREESFGLAADERVLSLGLESAPGWALEGRI